uniref:Fibroblast growth factor 7 n=1 Tax=Hucho hucho TaxID=62062 RepID=A0A4W5Q7I5_9TELE
MPRWMPLPCNLPNLLSGLYLHIIFLLGSVCVACSDCTPEQLAAIMNCSKHERHARNYDYMEGGDVRIRQLFSRTQWFLTVDDYGNINGTQDPTNSPTNCYSKTDLYTVYIQWRKKVFSQPPIVQVLSLKKMREACNFHHRYTSTMTDKMKKKNPENHIVGFLMNLFANYGGK